MSERCLQVMDSGVVFAGETGGPCQSATFPGICVLPSGEWLCTWRAAPLKTPLAGQHVLLSRSRDEGRTWSRPVEPFQAPVLDGVPGSIRAAYLTAISDDELVAALCWVEAADPEKPFFNEATEGLLDTRILLSRSSDRGTTWTPPVELVQPFFRCPLPITGPLLILSDNTWACQFELNKPYDDPAPWSHRSILLLSQDRGTSWAHYTEASGDPADRIFFWDQRPAVLPDGSVLDLFWTFDRQAAAYLNIHARRSPDGRTWFDMWDTGVPGQPASPVSLGDGMLCMVYVDRTAEPAIKARLSMDGGRTWPADGECVIHASASSQTLAKQGMQDAWQEMGRFSLGLPATAPLPDGEVLVVYYAGDHTDRTSIRWSRLKHRTLANRHSACESAAIKGATA